MKDQLERMDCVQLTYHKLIYLEPFPISRNPWTYKLALCTFASPS